jgi:fructose-specific phosphotransferase system IIA component
MVQLTEYLSQDLIITSLKAREKFAAMEEILRFLKGKKLVQDAEDAMELLRQREEIYSTGIGRSLAVPHALSKKMQKSVLALAVVEEGLPFDSIDQQPVHFIFMLLGPEENQRLHLQILAKIARLFRDRDLRAELLKAKTPATIREVIAKNEKKAE